MSYILIVDDNKFVSTCMAYILKRENYRVQAAENGKEALDMIRNSTPQLIISDVRMPVMDGFTFVQALKASETGSHIPVIICTSVMDDKERMKFIELGVTEYLYKGCESNALLRAVSQSYANNIGYID